MNIRTKYIIFFIFVSLCLLACKENKRKTNNEAVPYSVEKKKHRQELLDWNKDITAIDYDVIEKFIERRKWQMKISETGLYWQIISSTEQQQAEDGYIALIAYKTSLLDGKVLYSSEEFGNREFHLGHEVQESGLNEGILKMKKGEKARFIAPPYLAFGVPGDGYKVPYYSTLVYEIELLDLYKPEQETVLEDGWY